MKLQPVLPLTPDGLPVVPLTTEDLAPLAREATIQTLAKDASLQALLAALQALALPATKAHRLVVDLSAPMVDAALSLGPLAVVSALTVADLTGTVAPTLKLNGADQTPLPLKNGEVRDGLAVTSLHLSGPGGVGSLVLELHGR